MTPPLPEESIAKTLLILAAAGLRETLGDAQDWLLNEWFCHMCALAYLTDKTPRECCEISFQAAPPDEMWAKMKKELEIMMDNLSS